jgi:transmembrane sensor
MNTDMTDQTKIEQEAAAWVARLGSDSVTSEERQQFSRWVAVSPAHRQAYFAMRERWQALGQAARLSAPQQKINNSYRPGLMATAASILLAVTLTLFYPALRDRLSADEITAVGEHKTLQLADGSILHLNTDTAVAISFTPERRSIRLLHGEAEVVVAHAPSRPLLISVGHYQAMALGTDFSVASVNDDLKVTVFESSVQVSKDGNAIEVLKPGQQLEINEAQQLQQKNTVDLNEVDAWRDGKLIFTARPLQQVIDEINRYRLGHLFLFNKNAANRPVSGVFDINQLDNTLFVIAERLELKPVQVNGYVVALY